MYYPEHFQRDGTGKNMHVWQKDNLHQVFEAMFWFARIPASVRESISFVNLGKIYQVLPKVRQHV